MDDRKENIKRLHKELGINIASLKKADRKCSVCHEDTLLIVGKGYAGRTRYVCSFNNCNWIGSLI